MLGIVIDPVVFFGVMSDTFKLAQPVLDIGKLRDLLSIQQARR